MATLHDYVEKLKSLKATVQANLIAMGGLLYEIQQSRMYEGQYETWEEFLGSPEISFSRSTAWKAMTVYETFVMKFSMLDKITGIDVDKLYAIAAVVDTDNIREWIEKAVVLSRSDVVFEVRKFKGLPAHEPDKSDSELMDEFIAGLRCSEFGIKVIDRKMLKVVLLKWEGFKKEGGR